jgi:hypothetical protein
MRRRRQSWVPQPGTDLTVFGGEPTWTGRERWSELETPPHYEIRPAKAQRFRVQDAALRGLVLLLLEAMVLGMLAMSGVAARWFDGPFALEVLAITLTPSFAAWIVVVRWAFRRGGTR